MSSKPLTGILVALPTPFTSSGTLDTTALTTHIHRLLTHGLHGFVPGGSTGEFPALPLSTRKLLLTTTLSAAPSSPVIPHIGALTTAETLDLALHARDSGAPAVMVVPPFYDALDFLALKAYLREIHDACGLPIVYYNIPAASGITLTPSQLLELVPCGVTHLKDTSGSTTFLTALTQPPYINKIITLNGWDTLTFCSLAQGAPGAIWGAANVIPELCMELWQAFKEKNLDKAREVWEKVYPVCHFLEGRNYAAAVKTGMEIRGWATGGVKKPFKMLEGAERKEFEKILKHIEVI